MVGSPVSPGSQGSPAPSGVHEGHLVKPPVSPQHYTGGTMHTVPPQGPSPVGQPVYYPQPSVAHSGSLGVAIGSVQAPVPPRIPSPHHHQYYMSPGAPSPYSPEGPMGEY